MLHNILIGDVKAAHIGDLSRPTRDACFPGDWCDGKHRNLLSLLRKGTLYPLYFSNGLGLATQKGLESFSLSILAQEVQLGPTNCLAHVMYAHVCETASVVASPCKSHIRCLFR